MQERHALPLLTIPQFDSDDGRQENAEKKNRHPEVATAG